MNATVKIDAARVELLLSELRLPGIKGCWESFCISATSLNLPPSP